MDKNVLHLFVIVALSVFGVSGQVVQFGNCSDVRPVDYFQLDSFLGEWFEIQRFPSWYEYQGHCASKRLRYCNRRVEIEHVFVKDGIKFVLHVNSSYSPGDEAVFVIAENSIDPLGIPLSVVATDYKDYAVVYGCRHYEEMNLRYVSVWILSRTRSLSEDLLHKAQDIINGIPGCSTAYLEHVSQDERSCNHIWTAHVEAENVTDLGLNMARFYRRV